MEPRARPMLQGQVERLFRRPPPGFEAGDRIALDGMTVHILGVDGGGHPTRVRFVFAEPIEQHLVLIATPQGYVRYPLPGVGTHYDIASRDGRHISVVTHEDGRRFIGFFDPEDPDARTQALYGYLGGLLDEIVDAQLEAL